jgi:hypothetical protein
MPYSCNRCAYCVFSYQFSRIIVKVKETEVVETQTIVKQDSHLLVLHGLLYPVYTCIVAN